MCVIAWEIGIMSGKETGFDLKKKKKRAKMASAFNGTR